MSKWDLSQGCKEWFNIQKMNMIHHFNKRKDKKSHDYVNRCRKSIWQNSKPNYD